MLSGKRAFKGNTSIETMNAILKDDPLLYMRRVGELPARIQRVDLATSRKELWKELPPTGEAG
jgi:hypothetical protein